MGREIYKLDKEDFFTFVDNLIKNFDEVVGVKERNGKFVFSEINCSKELRLDYDTTILPPKEFFLPPYERIIKFRVDSQESNLEKDERSRIIIGIHPYDIIAIEQMDRVYLDDEMYRVRRRNTVIIGSDILNVSRYSFSYSLGTHTVKSGFDLFLTDLGDRILVEVGSKRGREILEKYSVNLKDVYPRDILDRDELRRNIKKKFKTNLNMRKDQIPFLLMKVFDHPLWDEISKRCMQCGSCTVVCPTCYCYDVQDKVSLSLEGGERIRTWDSCLLPDFTKIASGERFRKSKSERFRHRLYRKGLYLPFRYGFIACVGCGRCMEACLPKIASPADIINSLIRRKNESRGGLEYKIPDGVDTIPSHIPIPAVIRRIESLSNNEKLFEIELSKDRFDFIPGQFVEISIFGIGEAPISISSPPEEAPKFEIVVRKVGNVTGKLHSMREGDGIGIRGPLGRGFNIDEIKGKDIIFVAGGIGIVPLRSIIKYVLKKENREEFGRIFILYGSKTPDDVLFMNEIREWEKVKDVEVKLSVDVCPEGKKWDGCVGVVTTLFPMIEIENPRNTVSIVVGPPVMYKFVVECLKRIGIDDRCIYVSLERRMKCGFGKCGHCQINGVYVCKEGPVFRYSDIKDLPEAFS